jgi:hypothetical protein
MKKLRPPCVRIRSPTSQTHRFESSASSLLQHVYGVAGQRQALMRICCAQVGGSRAWGPALSCV